MIRPVTNKQELSRFIHFIETLYADDPYMVYPLFSTLTKELTHEVLTTKRYTALLCEREGEVVGRVLYTIDESRKQGKDIGYFSYFDFIEDDSVVRELLDTMKLDLSKQGIDYLEGSFTPYDPDNRRGVLVEGFDSPPVIFTSYNYSYYPRLLEAVGFEKAIDTVLLDAKPDEQARKRLDTVSRYFERSHDVSVDALDFKHIDRDLEDVHQVLQEATNEIIYQDAPSMDLIEQAARQMKLFLEPKLIRIAREVETGRPVGFCFVLPDYNQVFRKTKGRLRPLRFLLGKRKITKARGMMQYVVPDYQNTGLIGHMFKTIYDSFHELGITEFEAGTMMEDNPKPINAFKKFGGDIIKVYRLYGMEWDR
jgi:GNAT superfamily N-acetyltransferase